MHDIIYEHPTIILLASVVFKIGIRSPTRMEGLQPSERARAMMDMVARYSNGISSTERGLSDSNAVPAKDVFLVTGTTGALGAAVLAELVSSPDVGRIYALNRASDRVSLAERQRHAFAKQGLQVELPFSPKVQLVEVNIGDAGLGLTSALLEEVNPYSLFTVCLCADDKLIDTRLGYAYYSYW